MKLRALPTRLASLFIAILASTYACGPHPGGSGASPQDPATVRVVNSNHNTVNVFAVRGSFKQRMGTVTSMSSDVYEIPDYLCRASRELSLHVEVIGSDESFTSLPIPCESGDRIEWRVKNILRYSSAMVY